MWCSWECHAFHVGLGHVCTSTIFHNHSLIFFLCDPEQTKQKRMALQAPSFHIVNGNACLRRPLMNPFALKSSFFSGSLNLYLHPNHHHLTSAPPRISMRVASKQAYICRDCGLVGDPSFLFFMIDTINYSINLSFAFANVIYC